MLRAFALAGGLLFAVSLLFFGISYEWRFAAVEDWAWPAAVRPIAVDLALFTGFALHHSLFARTPLRAWVTRIWPAAIERSIYVWVASLLLVVVCAAWQPVPGTLWRAQGAVAAALHALQLAGAVFVLAAARRLDVLSLAGVRQAAEAPHEPVALDRGPYAFVRHPIYLGWFAIVWAAPLMTGTRFVFAAVSCLYLLVAIPLEERDLRSAFGPAYRAYAARVRWRLLAGIY